MDCGGICSYVEQLGLQNSLRLYTVSYECDHDQANVGLSSFIVSSCVVYSRQLIFGRTLYNE